VSKFWQEYCGKTSVLNVDNAVLSDYIAWRRDFYHKIPQQLRPKKYSLNPADKTLEWETTFAKTVIKFAHERGYRGKAALPTWRYKAERKIVRPSFSLQEYKLLYTTMRKWIAQTKNKNWRYTRELLRDYVLLLANSGMRVGEANNLRESDIVEFVDELGRKNYMFMVKGKTGKRVVIPRASAVRYVERTLERNAKWQSIWDSDVNKAKRKENSVRTQGYAEIHLKTDWFFRMSDGRQLITLIDQFKVLLKLCALEKNRYGEEYTLYSLRHFYAVQMLRRGKVSVFDVARNMGTSVQIIEQYYGKDATPLVLATALGG
jgi:integrase